MYNMLSRIIFYLLILDHLFTRSTRVPHKGLFFSIRYFRQVMLKLVKFSLNGFFFQVTTVYIRNELGSEQMAVQYIINTVLD